MGNDFCWHGSNTLVYEFHVFSAAKSTESVSNVVLQKSIPARIRQLILYISDNQGLVDGFARKVPFAKRL